MNKVSSTIEAKIRATLSPNDTEVALAAFSAMNEPPACPEWATTRARVQAAILISAQSNLESLLNGVANSQIDWRDTLMAGGLAESNWAPVAKEAGFDIA